MIRSSFSDLFGLQQPIMNAPMGSAAGGALAAAVANAGALGMIGGSGSAPGMTPAEIEGRIREYQYSTVMDYGNNFVVTDSEGIGHYDTAAIKMGYGDLVEVFTEASDVSGMAWYGAILRLGWPVALRAPNVRPWKLSSIVTIL